MGLEIDGHGWLMGERRESGKGKLGLEKWEIENCKSERGEGRERLEHSSSMLDGWS